MVTRLRGRRPVISLLGKVLLSFILILIPLYAINFAFLVASQSELRSEVYTSMQSKVEFYSDMLSAELDRISRQQRRIANDEDVVFLGIAGGIMSVYERIVAIRSLEERLFDIKNSSSYIESVDVYIPLLGYRITSDHHVSTIPPDEYEAMRRNADTDAVFSWHGGLFTSMAYPNATIAGTQPSLVVAVEYSSQQVSHMLSQIVINLGRMAQQIAGSAALYGNDFGWYVGTADRATVQSAVTRSREVSHAEEVPVRFAAEGVRYLFSVAGSEVGRFRLAFLVPEAVILEPLRFLFPWVLVQIIVSVMVIAVFSFRIQRLVDRPLRVLVSAFRRLEEGDFDQSLTYSRHDEFAYLYRRFNQTTRRLNSLVHEVYEQKYRLSRAELSQLQSQIKPHFLYNCFFTLYRIAKQEDIEKVVRFTELLGDYYRYLTFVGADEDVDLEEELRHAHAYAGIQKVRFEDRIEVVIDQLPESAKHLRVPRLILQPIMENAYQHGLEDSLEGGKLHVGFRTEDSTLIMTVEDNGKGMSPAELAELQERLAQTRAMAEHTGLPNVNRRLEIRYGAAYGVVVRPAGGAGLVVELRLPLDSPRKR